MPVDHLTEFLDLLADHGELVRISAPVDGDLELAAITSKIAGKAGGPALVFDRVAGGKFPVVTNLLGSERRLLLALGAQSFEEVAERITAVIQPSLPQSWLDVLQLVPKFAEVAAWPPQLQTRGLSQQVVLMGRDVDLLGLPVPRCWPNETLRAITSGQVIVEWPQAETVASPLSDADQLLDTAQPIRNVRRNVSRPTMQIVDRNRLLVHWTPHDPEWQMLAEYRKQAVVMPVAVAIGGDPLMTFAAHAPLPPFVDPLVFAGFLRRKPVALVDGRHAAIQVPADADFILEGVIDPQAELELAPPFAMESGSYSVSERVPVMAVTAITHRANPILPSIIPAKYCELDWYARAIETIFLPLVRLAVPEIVAIHRPEAGSFRHFGLISIRKAYPHHARKVMNALWGLDRFSTTKFLVVVDDDVDVRNEADVMRVMAANCFPSRDTIFSDGPADMHDHASPIRGVGSRIGFDATRKLVEEGHPREWPESLVQSPVIRDRVQARWKEYGLDRFE